MRTGAGAGRVAHGACSRRRQGHPCRGERQRVRHPPAHPRLQDTRQAGREREGRPGHCGQAGHRRRLQSDRSDDGHFSRLATSIFSELLFF